MKRFFSIVDWLCYWDFNFINIVLLSVILRFQQNGELVSNNKLVQRPEMGSSRIVLVLEVHLEDKTCGLVLGLNVCH